MTYQHPLAYLVAMEGVALLRTWSGGYDDEFVRARLSELRALLDDPALAAHPGFRVEPGVTRGAYRHWAATYDEPGNELLELDLPVIDSVLDGLSDVSVAVDVACGTGRIAGRLAGRGWETVGVDASPEMLERARLRVPWARFAAGSMTDLPLATGSVDLVTNALALTHVPDVGPVLAECARVLRPGGSVILSDPHPDLVRLGSVVKAVTPDGRPQQAATYIHPVGDVVRAALAAGFRIRRLEELTRLEDADEEQGEDARTAPSDGPTTELGDWSEWPWTLMELAPEAVAVAWDVPSSVVWHLQRD